jgi:poly(3-hydroxybutyrate) depolymerase
VHFTLAILMLQTGPALCADALPVLRVHPDAISVSGLSSGGFMAAQVRAAFSRMVMGAGILAGRTTRTASK